MTGTGRFSASGRKAACTFLEIVWKPGRAHQRKGTVCVGSISCMTQNGKGGGHHTVASGVSSASLLSSVCVLTAFRCSRMA